VSEAEPEFTIYVPAWGGARERVGMVEPQVTRALLCTALDLVESGWPAVRDLQRWVERHREQERAADDYGCLLTYVESEVLEAFRTIALTLAAVAADWPEWERASTDDVDGGLSAFVRYVTVLLLATEGAQVPPEFRELVHQVVPLRLGGEWSWQLSGVLEAIGDRSEAAGSVKDARSAVEFLTHALPAEERDRVSGQLLIDLEALYAATAPPPPEWLRLLRAYFVEHTHDASAAQPEVRHE
jgi:hypothetical protein